MLQKRMRRAAGIGLAVPWLVGLWYEDTGELEIIQPPTFDLGDVTLPTIPPDSGATLIVAPVFEPGSVPEPAAALLVVSGAMLLGVWRHRRSAR